MSENVQETQGQPQEAVTEVKTPLARGNAPALGAPTIEKPSEPANEGAPAVNQEANAPADDVADNELANTPEVQDDRYIETPIDEVNELTAELKRLKVPYAKANMLLEEAFAAADASKLNKENFEAILGKDNAKTIYMYAKVAIAAIKSNREASDRELDTLAGGSWKNLAAKAKQMLPKRDLAEYQELINMGGSARKIAIREIIAKTSSKSNNKPLLSGDNASVTDDYLISSSDYRKQSDEIRKNHTRAGMLTKEGFALMKALDARRMAGIKANIK